MEISKCINLNYSDDEIVEYLKHTKGLEIEERLKELEKWKIENTEIIEKNQNKIDWSILSKNPSIFERFKKSTNKKLDIPQPFRC